MALGTFESIIIYSFLTIFSIGMLFVSFLSFRRSKNIKIFFVTLVFLVFFIKSILLSLSIFFDDLNALISIPFLGVFDFMMIILLFIATLKK